MKKLTTALLFITIIGTVFGVEYKKTGPGYSISKKIDGDEKVITKEINKGGKNKKIVKKINKGGATKIEKSGATKVEKSGATKVEKSGATKKYKKVINNGNKEITIEKQ